MSLFPLRLMKITSTANPRVKAAAKLRNSRERTAQNRIAINGLRKSAGRWTAES